MTQHDGKKFGAAKAVYELPWDTPGKFDDNDLVDFVMNNYHAGKERRIRWEYQAQLQLAWARGNQRHNWNRDIGDLVDTFHNPNAEEELLLEERAPVIINMLKRFITGWIGLIINKPINWHVFPQTNEAEDIAAAQLSTKLLRHYWSSGVEHNMVRFLHALWHMYCTGIIWGKPMWDAQRRFAEHSGKAQKTGKLPDGDLELDWVTGFELTEPEGCRNMKECGWIIETRLRTIEWGMERYGDRFKDIRPDSRDDQYSHFNRYHYGVWTDYTSDEVQGELPDDRVVVHEIWRPSSRSVPNGFRAVVANQEVIHKGPHPYEHGRLPYVPLQEQPDFDHFRPGSSIRDLMPLQAARNRNRSQVLAHFDKSVDPKIMAEESAGLPDDAFEGHGPKVITVKNNALTAGRIRPFAPPEIPAYVFHVDEINRRDMEDVAGVHSNTLGRPESSQQSGRHAALMTQGDARTNAVTRMLVEKSLSKIGQQQLWLMFQFVTSDRMVTVVGENEEPNILRFKGKALSPKKSPFEGPFEFNIQAQIGIEPDQNTTLAKIDLLLERGVLNPQLEEDKLRIFRMLGDEVPGDVDDTRVHRANARMEGARIMSGEVVLASPGDDHAIHEHEHQLIRTTAEYKKAMLSDPSLESRMDAHILTHINLLAERPLERAAVFEKAKEDVARRFGIPMQPPPEQQVPATNGRTQAPQGAA